MKHFLTLTRMRVQLTLRNKMFLFFSVIMPFGFFFLYSGVFAKGVPEFVRYFIGPVTALTVMGSFWGLSAALVTFREQGILRRFHVTPITASDMLASSILANFILAWPTVVVELLFARFIFHVQSFGDLFSFAVLITLGAISFSSMGLVVASVTNTMQETQVINQLIWLPLIFLSGATLPLPYLPVIAQRVGIFLPATYLVTGLQNAICSSFSVWHLRIEIFSLSVWAILTFFVAANLFRWEPESKIPRNAKLWALATALPFLVLGVWENRAGVIQSQAQATYRFLQNPSKTGEPANHSNPSEQEKKDPTPF